MSLSIGLSIGIDRSFSGQAGGGLSAPTLGYPSPLATNPSSIVVHFPVDWQSGDTFKLPYSSSVTMSPATILSHAITDTDITNGSFSFPLPTFAGINYLQGYGNHAGVDSLNKSGIVTWGDTTAPTITTSASQSVYEQVPLAITLAATDTGGVPAQLSDGTKPGWYISGGADQLQFQIAIVTGVPTLQWYNNGVEVYSSPQNVPPNAANPYNVQVTAIDYGGNKSTAQNIAVTVNAISVSAFSFTNVSNAALSTLYTSNTVTFTIAPTGLPLAASLSGTGFSFSKNGGAYQASGSIPGGIQNGDTLSLQVTSGASNQISETATVTVGSQTATWSVNTPGSYAVLSTSGTGKNSNITISGSPALSFAGTNGAGFPQPDRATIEAQSDYTQFEVTVTGLTGDGGGQFLYVGWDNGADDFSASNVAPGHSDNNGVTVKLTANNVFINWNTDANGATLSSVAGVVAVNDVYAFRLKKSTNTVSIFRTRSGTTTQIGTDQTIPSFIHYYAYVAPSEGQAGTVNFGATAFARTLGPGESIYG